MKSLEQQVQFKIIYYFDMNLKLELNLRLNIWNEYIKIKIYISFNNVIKIWWLIIVR